MFSNPFNKAVTVLDGRVTVHDESAIASPAMDKLVYTAVFGEPDDREDARWLIWEIGQEVGVQPCSIHDLYRARGRGLVGGFTVPAMNIRGMAYDTGRALFRSAVKLKVAPVAAGGSFCSEFFMHKVTTFTAYLSLVAGRAVKYLED